MTRESHPGIVHALLSPDEPGPFKVLNPLAEKPILLVCDHASHRFPKSLGDMGLDPFARRCHLAVDIGAGRVTESLAKSLGVTAVVHNYSRLVVDCNRQLMDPGAFLEYGDGILVPGNRNLHPEDKELRSSALYWPYHCAIDEQVQRLKKAGPSPAFISIHSFTPVLNGESRKTKVFLMTTNGVPEKFFMKGQKSATALNIMATSESAGRGAAAYIAGPMSAKKVACFMPDYVIGKTTFKGYEAVMAGNGSITSEAFWVPVKTADMTPYLIKVKEYAPDVLFMGSWGGDAINALKAANEMGLSKKLKIFHFWLANVFAVGIPAEAMEGIWSQMFWYWNMAGFKDAEVVIATKAFSDKYIAAYGNPPDPYAMAAYAGVIETARAMNLSGSTGPAKMYASLMAKPDWAGPKGPATWRKDGRPMYKYATYIVEGKGPAQRSGQHSKYDYAKIVDAYAGKAFLPPLKELGY